MEIPFGYSPLLLLVPRTYFRWASCWNFPVGASELIPFVARSDRFCYSRSAEIPSWGFLLVFPRWGFTLIVCSQGTQFSPVGGLLLLSFLGELHTFSFLSFTEYFIFAKFTNSTPRNDPCFCIYYSLCHLIPFIPDGTEHSSNILFIFGEVTTVTLVYPILPSKGAQVRNISLNSKS